MGQNKLAPAREVVINGVYYPSMYEAAKALGVTRAAISKIVKRKGTVIIDGYAFRRGKSTRAIPVEYGGKVYPSIRALGKELGLSKDKIYRCWSLIGTAANQRKT